MKQGSFSTPDELYNSGNMVLFLMITISGITTTNFVHSLASEGWK